MATAAGTLRCRRSTHGQIPPRLQEPGIHLDGPAEQGLGLGRVVSRQRDPGEAHHRGGARGLDLQGFGELGLRLRVFPTGQRDHARGTRGRARSPDCSFTKARARSRALAESPFRSAWTAAMSFSGRSSLLNTWILDLGTGSGEGGRGDDQAAARQDRPDRARRAEEGLASWTRPIVRVNPVDQRQAAGRWPSHRSATRPAEPAWRGFAPGAKPPERREERRREPARPRARGGRRASARDID